MNKKLLNKNVLAIAVCWLVYTCSYLGKLGYNANIILIEREFGVAHAESGSVDTAFFFAYGAGQIVNGLLCKKYNVKYTIFFALIVSAVSNFTLTVITDFAWLKIIWLINGAAFVASVMATAQSSSAVDMLMYYDTRPSAFNGVFDFYTYRPLKTYTCFKWYGEFYDLISEVGATTALPKDIYMLCGVDKDGKVTAVITHYSENDEKENAKIKVDFGKDGEYDVFLLDKDHDGERVKTATDLTFDMPVHTCIKIKER